MSKLSCPTYGLQITPIYVGETVVLALAGDLDIASVPRLERCLDDALRTGCGRVVIDLSNLLFIDSSGLHALLLARDRLAGEGGELRLRPGRPAVQRLFALTQTAERFRWADEIA